MSSEKFRITTNGQSLRNPNNAFFDMTLSANLTIDESNDISANNDRRSAHNALERQRREHLNLKYQQLAEALPTLKSTRRPSKATIVTSSLEFVTSTLKRESKYMAEIKKLRLENEKLKEQAKQFNEVLEKSLNHSSKEKLPPKENVQNKRKNEIQLSPPLTPKTLKEEEVEERRHQKKKKRTMKEEEAGGCLPAPLGTSLSQSSVSTTSSSNFDVLSLVPSPLNSHTDNSLLYMNSQMNTYDSSSNNSSPHVFYDALHPIPNSFNNMLNPLLTQFYGPSEDLLNNNNNNE
ncbi:hypothetical protein G6F62_003458 [Rhizopus arrhizus]|nr:hypothetical protein G6F23_004356 [Rhizopus arrhizus]KAG1290611.1 hypothetical protein G6F66_008497 [Rhizopus arrhizus]KAG1349811.1 hypothetical protein G6F62_003458 [Rhizopus arrhizus]